MIDIKLNLNNVPGHIDVNQIAQEISSLIKSMTGKNTNINVNMRDNFSTSPLGIHKTQEYMKLRDRI